MKRFIAIWILLSAGLNIWQMDRIRDLEEKKPMVIYKADNAGAEVFGKVVEKGRHGKLYTVTIRDYGIFVVTREQYDKEKMFYDIFSLFQTISIAILVVSSVVLAVLTIIYFTYDGGFVYTYECKGKSEEEVKLERIERKRKDLKLPIKISCISSSASLITLVVAIILKVTLAPNYIFIVNEILPRLTKR